MSNQVEWFDAECHLIEFVSCFECDREFMTDRFESICQDCQESININRAHA